jgi:hypothetical protein
VSSPESSIHKDQVSKPNEIGFKKVGAEEVIPCRTVYPEMFRVLSVQIAK